MSLADRVHQAREIADRSINPNVHRFKLAMEGVLHAETREFERSFEEPISIEGIPPPPVEALLIERPDPPSPDLPAWVPPPVAD